MAIQERHIAQWKHNRAFLSTILPEYPDWIVTACFYVAVHAVDALLSHDKIFPTSHDSRNDVLVKTNRYLAACKSYFPLYTLSRTVRYFADPGAWIRHEDIERQVLGRYLYPLEKTVQRLIGVDLGLAKIVLCTAKVSGTALPPGEITR